MGKNNSWKPYGKSHSRGGDNQGRGGGKWGKGHSDCGSQGQRYGVDLSKAERSSGSVDLAELHASEAWGNRVEYTSPKRKYAVSFGYLGSAYHGLQANPGCATVEQQLERALFLAGGIQESNFGILQKLQWSRAARTDKGVHANVQCCAMKLAVPISGQELMTQYVNREARQPVAAASMPRPELPEAYAQLDADAAETVLHRLAFIERVNSFLPTDIRMHTMTKVTKNFNAKSMCERRRYHYLLPTYLVQPRDGLQAMLQTLFEEQGPVENAARDGGWALNGQISYLGRPFLERAHAGELVSGYRISAEQLAALRDTCKMFEGTHKFHNYTTGKTPTDANGTRYIISFTAGEPYVGPGGVEWVLLTVIGQSFLLNQIRKMVGMICEVASGATGPETLARTLSNSKVECPMMPGLGLYLDELFFDGYNNKARIGNKQNIQKAKTQALKRQVAVAATAAPAAAADISPSVAAGNGAGEMNAGAEPADEQPVKKQRIDDGATDSAGGDASAYASASAIASAGAIANVATSSNTTGNEAADDQDATHELLEWGKDVHVLSQWDFFRTCRVWPHIQTEEASSLAFLFYLDALRVHPRKYISYDFSSRMPNDGSAADGAGVEEEEQGVDAGSDNDE